MTTDAKKFEMLLDELERWNKKVNLTAVRDRDEILMLVRALASLACRSPSRSRTAISI